MKFSQFNIFQEYEGQVLIYNSFQDTFLVVELFLYEMVKIAMNNNEPLEIKEFHEEFYNAMVENGMIISIEINEISQVEERMLQINEDRNSYRLIVNPTMNCNFKCWYCYETHIKDSKMGIDNVEKTQKFVHKLIEHNKDLQHLRISFFGGEPLLYFKNSVLPLLVYAHEVCKESNIQFNSDFTTNGYLINDEMINYFRIYNIDSFQITLDGSEEYHNKVRFVNSKKGSYKKIMENVKKLISNSFHVSLRINFTKENIDSIDKIIFDIEKSIPIESRQNFTISLQKVWQDETEDYRKKINNYRIIMKNLGFQVTHSKTGDAITYSCYADRRNQARINYNGDVFKCSARDFTPQNREGILDDDGNINWNYRHDQRFESRLKNPPCLVCSILPICGGGCSQKALENLGKEYCVNDFDDDKKKAIVFDRFLGVLESI